MEDLQPTDPVIDAADEATGGSRVKRLLLKAITVAGLAAVASLVAKRFLKQGPSDNWQSSYTPSAPKSGDADA